MLSTTNTAVPVVIPSPQHPSSASVPQTLNAFAPAPVNGWNQDNSSAATKSFFDFRPIRTGSNEAVVGDNNNSSTNIPGKAPIRLSTITNTSISAVDATKPRSLSAGRIRMSGGSDLIQGIYDRLGVERGDLATSKMKVSAVHQGGIRQSFKNSGNGTMNEAYTTADSNRSTTRGRTTVQNSADIGTNDDVRHVRVRYLEVDNSDRFGRPPKVCLLQQRLLNTVGRMRHLIQFCLPIINA